MPLTWPSVPSICPIPCWDAICKLFLSRKYQGLVWIVLWIRFFTQTHLPLTTFLDCSYSCHGKAVVPCSKTSALLQHEPSIFVNTWWPKGMPAPQVNLTFTEQLAKVKLKKACSLWETQHFEYHVSSGQFCPRPEPRVINSGKYFSVKGFCESHLAMIVSFTLRLTPAKGVNKACLLTVFCVAMLFLSLLVYLFIYSFNVYEILICNNREQAYPAFKEHRWVCTKIQ
jgi:hypothetical protein